MPPTFLGNHDIGRAAQKVRASAPAPAGRSSSASCSAYDLLYLLRGAPVVYYGDEFGIVGRGGDKEARQDLFPTQVAEWQTEPRVGSPPVGTGSSFDMPENPIAARLRQLGRAPRPSTPVLSTGATIVRRAVADDVLAVSRIDAAGKREYLAFFNAGGSPARMTIADRDAARRVDAAPRDDHARVEHPHRRADAHPARLLECAPPGDAPDPRGARGEARAEGRARLAQLARPRLRGRRSRPVSVSFAVRRGLGKWTRIAADDSPPYRTFLDPAKFRRGERVYLVAIVRTLQGRTAVSAVRSYLPRR